MQQILKHIRDTVIRVEQFLCFILLLAMMLVTVWGVFERFVLKMGLGWTDEVARFISIYCVFIGASLGVVKGAHIGVDVFVRLLPVKYHKAMGVVSYALSALFCAVITWTGYSFFIRLMTTRQVSTALRLPICWVFLAIPAGCALMFIHYIIRILMMDVDVPDTVVPQDQKGEST